MELTTEQIEDLYKFTRQHYVEHYDIQTELVDHLANDIEQICKEKPSLTFNEARDISFKKFGIFGFMEVVEQKQGQLQKKYFKILWKFTKEWFKLPKIVLTICLMFFFYWFLQFNNISNYIIGGLFLTIFILSFYKLFSFKRKINKQLKKWLFQDILLIQGIGNVVIFINPFLQTADSNYGQGGLKTLLFSILYTFCLVVFYVSLFVIPKKSEDLLKDHYPEYQLS